MKQTKYIFIGVLLYGFVIHLATKGSSSFVDNTMWADQIQYFLNRDPREFNFYGAYGHPGTTLVGLGSLLHILFGVSYLNAVTLSMSFLMAAATAACVLICLLLYPRSLWWLSTAFILTFSRLYICPTPPTAIVMPFIALIVLATWWLWEHSPKSKWLYSLWGAVIGLSAATRLDVTVLVAMPMSMLLWYRNGRRAILPILAGAAISFFVSDPFLWFMPIQHLTDLVHKFTIHHGEFSQPTVITTGELIRAIPLAAMSIVWLLVLIGLRRQTPIIPSQIIIVFLGVSFLAGIVILSSRFQAMRYFYPLIIVWEIFLPLLALETFSPASRHEPSGSFPSGTVTSWSIMGLVILTQILSYGLTI